MTDSEVGEKGPVGKYGPNDYGYLNYQIREAADILVGASTLWSEGHYPHSNAKDAADALGMSRETLRTRIKNNTPGFSYE